MENRTDKRNMKTIITINKILQIYDDSLDLEHLNTSLLNADSLHISKNRFVNLIKMLYEGGYISGVDVREFNDGTCNVDYSESQITMEGLKYYAENTNLLKKLGYAFDIATGVISVSSALIK